MDPMASPDTEADARIVIDDGLRVAGWDPADKGQVRTEVHVSEFRSSGVQQPRARYGSGPGDEDVLVGPEMTGGRADYILYDQSGHPLAVIEAKKNAIHPYVAKQQALPYAQSVGAPFIFLTNGELTYFWDYQNDDARPVAGFFSRRDLERLVAIRTSRKPLATIEIPEHYLRTGEGRAVRPYQQDGMRAPRSGVRTRQAPLPN